MLEPAPRYCAYFCEENIWHLCAHPHVAGVTGVTGVTGVAAECCALFISNRDRKVAVWGQRLCPDPELPIAWDYHVVLLFRRPHTPWQIWDLDAHTNTPQLALTWLANSFRGAQVIPEAFLPRFRLVPAPDYRRHLHSDRRHMRDDAGRELQPHPPWPLITGEPAPGQPAAQTHNLDRFLDTYDREFLGRVFDLAELSAYSSATQTEIDPGA